MSDARFKDAIAAMNAKREETGIDMNGKKYSMVKDRVETFRLQFGAEFGIETELVPQRIADDSRIVTMRARIIHIQSGNTAGSGHAMAFYGSDEVNTTSIVEAVETAAIGRALASFGLHGGEYASDREMQALPAKKEGARAPVKMSTDKPAQAGRPSVNQYKFFQPGSARQEDMDKVYDQIDRIETVEELTAYYNLLAPMLPHFPDQEHDEIKASFKARNNQLKG